MTLRVSDSFTLQEVIPYEIPLQRVLIRLPVLLRLRHLLGISRNILTSRCEDRVLSLARCFSCTLLVSLLDFRLCKCVATGFTMLGMCDERDMEDSHAE